MAPSPDVPSVSTHRAFLVPGILPGICLHGGGPVADIFDVANLAGLSQRCAGGFVAAERHRAFPDEAACIAFHSA